MDHIVLTTARPEACLTFYQVLGFTVRDAEGRYELFAGDFKINVHVQGRELSPHAAHIQPGSVDFCLETDESPEVVMDRLTARGIAVELGVVDRTGVRGPMRSLYLRDPDGNLVELCWYG